MSLVEDLGHATTVALGPTLLKNVSVAVVYSITDHTIGPSTQVLDPICRMFVGADSAPARLAWDDRIWHFCSFECAPRFAQDPERHSSA